MTTIPLGPALSNLIDGYIASIDTKTAALVGGKVPVDASGTVAPLPTGASTAALQTSGNASLTSIDSKIAPLLPQSAALDTVTQTMVGGSVTTNPPIYNDGKINPLSLSTRGQLRNESVYADSANLDAFSRLRVSNPETIFDSKQLVDNQPLFFDDQNTAGTGTTSTYLTNQAATKLSVANLTAGTRVRQTFQRFNYQSGKSMAIFCTGVLGSGQTGITRRIGYFSTNNGVYFQLSGTTLSVVVRSNVTGSPVNTVITQANWNLDKLDGTGPSGITIDTTKAQIFIIDFQWLGVGRVRYAFDIGGVVIPVHQILNANVLSTVWTSIPNQPIRYEISNDGTGPAADLIHICSSIIVEGGRHDLGTVLSIDRGVTGFAAAAGTSLYPILAIRLKSTHQMATIHELSICITCASNSTYRYCLLLNPTIVGTALSFTSLANSAIEYQINTTNATSVTDGTQFLSGYIDATTTQGVFVQELPSDLRLGSTIAGVSDILVLGVQTVIGAAETYYGGMAWREQI